MTIRKILVPVDGTERSRPALTTAMKAGIALDAHVEVLHVRIPATAAVPLVGEGMSGALIEDLIELTARETAERAAVARATYEEVRRSCGVAIAEAPTAAGACARFVERSGLEDEEVIRAGRLADLVVVARPLPQLETAGSATFNAAVLEAGAPVLVAAATAPEIVGGRIVVAWNASTEVARAVRSALPLLARARAVEVVAIDEDDRSDAGTDVVEYLAWHGIGAARRALAGTGSTGEALAAACAGAELVVMGAYTHSRLWQIIIGSATRYMIERTALPLLMAH
jgi:nucleotide-binding universal stress UspA family protein